MKKLFIISVLFFCVLSIAQAQRGGTARPSQTAPSTSSAPARQQMDPAQRIESQTNQLKETLGLTADQVTKVKAILSESTGNMGQGFQPGAQGQQPSQEEMQKMREQMQTRQTEQQNKIKAVLNDGQKTKYDTYLKEQQAQRQNRTGGFGAPAGGN